MNKTILTALSKLQKSLQLEKEEEKNRIHEILASQSLKSRIKAGITLFPLVLRDWNYDRAERLIVDFEINRHEEGKHEFSNGQLVGFFNEGAGAEDANDVTGIVMGMRSNSISVMLHADDLPHGFRSGKPGLNLLYDESSYREMDNALQQLKTTENPRLQELIETAYGLRQPTFSQTEDIARMGLNQLQHKACVQALSADDLFVIHGPPGTGKTTTLVQFIKAAKSSCKGKILVCAPSNNAVDLLVEKLSAADLKVLRIGHPARINEHLQAYSLHYKISAHQDYSLIKKMRKKAAEYRDMASKYKRRFGPEEREQRKVLFKEAHEIQKDANKIEDYIRQDLLDEADIIAATPVGSANFQLEGMEFPLCILDEASQALEPASWIPILKSKKVVFAGDHKQLPPTVKSYEAARNGLNISLFERCMDLAGISAMLNTQYRMHPLIMGFSNEQFYQNELLAADALHNQSLSNSLPTIAFIDTAGCSFQEEGASNGASRRSLQNPEEANLLIRHLAESIQILHDEGKDLSSLSIGLISPYKGQVELLRNELPELLTPFRRYKIDTIDGFQGQEADIIYISLVRSNERNEIGFLKDYRRMNVALTRAKSQLVLIGDSATLANDAFYNECITYFERKGSYRTAWELLYD